jgi:hypothetical protein
MQKQAPGRAVANDLEPCAFQPDAALAPEDEGKAERKPLPAIQGVIVTRMQSLFII